MEAAAPSAPTASPKPAWHLAADYDLDATSISSKRICRTPSLYRNLQREFEDTTFQLASASTPVSRLGCGFFDMDNDGWPTFLLQWPRLPEVEQLKTERATAAQTALQNLRNGRSHVPTTPPASPLPSRAAAPSAIRQ